MNHERGISNGWMVWLGGCLALFACGLCALVLGLSGALLAGRELLSQLQPTGTATLATPVATATLRPSPTPAPAEEATAEPPPPATATSAPTAEPFFAQPLPDEIDQGALPPRAAEDLRRLLEATYPARDYFEVASRLGQTPPGDRTIRERPYQPGQTRNFFAGRERREAILVTASEHAYFWFEATLEINAEEVNQAAEDFESTYYPIVSKLFGPEWRPGVDNDPRFSILHLDGFSGDSELGFFDSGDEYPRTINSFSNEQELLYLNMRNLQVGEELYFGTLVHELQHLIQWRLDPSESAWLNEGLSQVTEIYAGFDTVDTAVDYLRASGTQLNTWEYGDDEDSLFAHYGAAFLFCLYFWERFGDDGLVELASQPADGLAAAHAVLSKAQPRVSLADFSADWAAANYLDHRQAGGPYSYRSLELERPSHAFQAMPDGREWLRELDQYGVNYVRLNWDGRATLSFAGDRRLELTSAPPVSGQGMWYAPASDELDASLSASFDLTGLERATLNFWAWFELEDGFDFAYLSASEDGGQTWELLAPEHADAGQFGPGFTGSSARQPDDRDGWVAESLSLDRYAGGPVTLRFEVITDGAITGRGFALDDIAIPELGYAMDAEEADERWRPAGFVLTGWRLPQLWEVRLIRLGSPAEVVPLELNASNRGRWELDLGDSGGALVVAPVSPIGEESVSYWLKVER
ncbi:MAG: hypothetical protein ACRDHL_02410 [Candidatus Promineifilaceae bacterium]